eukprot:6214847-Pleurochrysis_carterae.AAC.15
MYGGYAQDFFDVDDDNKPARRAKIRSISTGPFHTTHESRDEHENTRIARRKVDPSPPIHVDDFVRTAMRFVTDAAGFEWPTSRDTVNPGGMHPPSVTEAREAVRNAPLPRRFVPHPYDSMREVPRMERREAHPYREARFSSGADVVSRYDASHGRHGHELVLPSASSPRRPFSVHAMQESVRPSASPRRERIQLSASPRQERPRRSASPQPERPRRSASPQQERPRRSASPRPERPRRSASPRPERPRMAASPRPERHRRDASPVRPHRSPRAASPRWEERVQLSEMSRAERSRGLLSSSPRAHRTKHFSWGEPLRQFKLPIREEGRALSPFTSRAVSSTTLGGTRRERNRRSYEVHEDETIDDDTRRGEHDEQKGWERSDRRTRLPTTQGMSGGIFDTRAIPDERLLFRRRRPTTTTSVRGLSHDDDDTRHITPQTMSAEEVVEWEAAYDTFVSDPGGTLHSFPPSGHDGGVHRASQSLNTSEKQGAYYCDGRRCVPLRHMRNEGDA